MRIAVVGATGQVAWELQRTLACRGDLIVLGRQQLDLNAPESVAAALDLAKPDLVINAAAYTAVDKAESDEAAAHRVNADSPAEMARWCAPRQVPLIHYSTDYVFDGSNDRAYVESDPTAPLGAYGRTKLAGEQGIAAAGGPHLILRTSWVYAARGGNFLRTMLRLSRDRDLLRVVDDQWGAPTWARAIAQGTADLVSDAAGRAGTGAGVAAGFEGRSGVYHFVCAGETTWRRFAEAIFAAVPDPDRKLRVVEPIGTADYPTPARRPANSRLSCDKLARDWGVRLPPWEQALTLCVAESSGLL